ncbi:glycoside hydrolase family 16 protein [Parachitinimonas caeni]|uniref:Glycoside hydrolase family 16 protein n=1 Tax=Parachitinimonas caeni TaxID=3031301 RepID=A0ABT7DZE2_9NEIS|nr:glycoside hydrolase family 16 protein [Parachitinimonas caeni]MDK2125435.1 glycoside hydrolase family 16 protein [Parachitinimonas caeni]
MKTNYLTHLALITTLAMATAHAKTINFSGYTWDVRNEASGGPGPNRWDENNVWVDWQGQLHLKIANRNGQWSSAELFLRQRLGFGTYQFKLIGRPDWFDDNVVLGLFSYTRPDIGPDGTNEIDIELSRWGSAGNPVGNYGVFPAVRGYPQAVRAFHMGLNGDYTTHRFFWTPYQITFQSLHGHQDGNENEMSRWQFSPADYYQRVPQNALPIHMNLWLYQGMPPKNGQEVEIIISEFKFIPA